MVTYDFQTIKDLLQKSIENGWEAELTLYMNHMEYMIIIYDDHCSFQRCGYKNGSGEYNFPSLDTPFRFFRYVAALLPPMGCLTA